MCHLIFDIRLDYIHLTFVYDHYRYLQAKVLSNIFSIKLQGGKGTEIYANIQPAAPSSKLYAFSHKLELNNPSSSHKGSEERLSIYTINRETESEREEGNFLYIFMH